MDKMNTKQRKEWMTGTPQEEEMKRLDSDNVGSRAKVLEPPHRRYVYKSGGRVHVSVSKYRSDAEFIESTSSLLDTPPRYAVVDDNPHSIAAAVQSLRADS